MGRTAARSPVAVFLLSLLSLAALQAAQIAVVHGGDPTGPFLIGERAALGRAAWPLPVKVLADSEGYDGQFVLALALDPLLRTPLTRALDDPRYRAHRITWSLAAWLLGAGQPAAVVLALYLLNILAIATGGYAIARWAVAHGASALWGFTYVFSLGALTCLWRMVGDAVMVSLLLLGVVLASEPSRRTGAANWLLGLAVLQKETAILALGGLAGFARRPEKRRTLLPLLAALALVGGWWLHVARRTPPGAPVLAINFGLPGVGIFHAFGAAADRASGPLARVKDFGLLGLHMGAIALGLAIGALELRRRFATVSSRLDSTRLDSTRRIILPVALFALLCVALSQNVWIEPWAYARALLPLVAFELLYSISTAKRRDRGGWPSRAGEGLALASLGAGLLFVLRSLAFRIP